MMVDDIVIKYTVVQITYIFLCILFFENNDDKMFNGLSDCTIF